MRRIAPDASHGWKTPQVIIFLILGLGCLFGFAVWQNINPHPLLNPKVWKDRNFTLCILSVMFGYMSFISSQFWISLYMQDIQKMSPLHIAVRLLPQAIAGLFWSWIGGKFLHKLNGTYLMGVGAISYFVGAVLLTRIRADTSYWQFLFPSLLITVIGADFQFLVSNVSFLPITRHITLQPKHTH